MKRKLVFLIVLVIEFNLNVFSQEFNCNSIYNPIDVTTELQEVIDNPDISKIIIPYMGEGTKWNCGPLELKSNCEIYFEPGVILEAIVSLFDNSSDVLFRINECSNVKLIGKNTTITMNKNEIYSQWLYGKGLNGIDAYGEHRHLISILGSSNITIEGLTLEGGGGDGIYISKSSTEKYFSDTVFINNIKCINNARNGISIISVKNLTIENSTFSQAGSNNNNGWSGAICNSTDKIYRGLATCGPYAGIDFEPNNPEEYLENISVRKCIFEDNIEYGMLFSFQHLNNASPAISILFEDNIVRHSNKGVYFTRSDFDGINGNITINDLTIENTYDHGIYLAYWVDGEIDVVFNGVLLDNPSINNLSAISFYMNSDNKSEFFYNVGNVSFYNSYIINNSSGIAFKYAPHSSYSYYLKNVNLELYLENENDQIQLFMPNNNVLVNKKTLSSKNTVTITGDFNGDGYTDLFTKGFGRWRSLYIWDPSLKEFKRIFSSSRDNILGTDSEDFLTHPDARLYPGDYNGDGRTDFFVKGFGTWRCLYTANKNSIGFTRQFASPVDNDGGMHNEERVTSKDAEVYPGDYNGDGKTDLFIKGFETWRCLYLANSTGTGFNEAFASPVDNDGGMHNEGRVTSKDAEVYPGDYNGDGKTDLFFKGFGTWRCLYLANSTGTGFNEAFASPVDNDGGMHNEGRVTSKDAEVYPGDYNGDGKTDLFFKGFETWRCLYLANSTGTGFNEAFASPVDNDGGMHNEGRVTSKDAEVYPGDYNGDGKTDLFFKGFGTWRCLYLANSTGTGFNEAFASPIDNDGGMHNEGRITSPQARVFPGYFNNDNKTDLFFKGFETWRCLYLANSTGTGFNEAFASADSYAGGTENYAWFIYNEICPTNLNSNDLKTTIDQENKKQDNFSNLDITDQNIFPNPFSDYINLSGNSIEEIRIFNSQSTLLKVIINCGNIIDMSSYSNGIYFFQIKTKDGNYIKKMIKL